MKLNMKVTNIKSINSFEFDFPLTQGLYAITGENGCGKSTLLACAATSFYNPLMYSYFGPPVFGSKIEFEVSGNCRKITSKNGRWFGSSEYLGITGFYEGSLIYGNRFKDVDFNRLKTLAGVNKSELLPSTVFVKDNLGSILHDNKRYYKDLYILNPESTKKHALLKEPYYYEINGKLINQLTMSTGENLLISILHSLKMRIKRKAYGEMPIFILLDEIELALHSSALRRLMYFLDKLAKEHNLAVFFSTHSIELIRSIPPSNIYYLQRHLDNSLEVINPCYPIYATRNLESSNYGHDYIIMVEDVLAKSIIERIFAEKRLLNNKRVLVIAVGGWGEVLRFAYDTIRSNLTIRTTKILIVLDNDIKAEVPGFMKKNNINFANQPVYLPLKSLEKFLLDKLCINIEHKLFRELNDYVFQGKPLSDIVAKYNENVLNGTYKDTEKIMNGKVFYGVLKHEMEQIRKNPDILPEEIVKYLFANQNDQITKLVGFFQKQFGENA